MTQSRLEVTPSMHLMVVPLCECGSRTIAVDSIRHGKFRECWRAYHNVGTCKGTQRFQNNPYADVEYVPLSTLPERERALLGELLPRLR